MITVVVKIFAGARDIVGAGELQLTLPGQSPASAVLESLEARHPALTKWRPYLKLAVNQNYAQPSHILNDGDEVAVIPPVSGG